VKVLAKIGELSHLELVVKYVYSIISAMIY